MYLGLFRNDYKTLLGYYDGTDQLYPALYYYGDWLKGLFSNLIHGTLPTWSWDIGLGSDVITTLGYYVVGDPFALLAGCLLYTSRYHSKRRRYCFRSLYL